MIKVITYGTYDLLHYGHVKLLERAKALGDYLIVGVTSEDFDWSRGKINVKQSLMERVEAVRATGIADEIIIEEYEGQKIDDIKRYDVDIFTVGSDWVGKFDYLKEFCEVVYLDRTKGISSSSIRTEERRIRLGFVGESDIINKYINECNYVNGIDIVGIYTQNYILEEQYENIVYDDYQSLLEEVDAVYLVSEPSKHFEHIKCALDNKKHVLCEAPVALSRRECAILHSIANSNGCILMDAIRTAFAMAYSRLLAMIKAGKIGQVVSVDATATSMREIPGMTDENLWSSICSWGPITMLPVFQILGHDYKQKMITSKMTNKEMMQDAFTKVAFVYESAVASVKVGKDVKSEGELIVSGTKGYIYVPAPWWKTDYFEVRYENPLENKRFFFQLDGEGIRYELVAFVKAIETGKAYMYISENDSMAISGVIEDFYSKKDFIELM